MPQLEVKGLDRSEWGSSIVRLHQSHRSGIERYDVARITNTSDRSRSYDAVLLGHDDDSAIYMAFDTRQALGVKKNAQLDFELKALGWFDKLRWYLRTPDPRIFIPAWLAIWSVGLGVVGIVLGVVSLFK
ncbi:hypothetical protein [Alkalilacustris brevis]|uniref:hypothetical protein n=1 Tax=Alkalilacustris brevis TaxID=2026338 RepID=UPI0012D3687A|nr:hypothetical protein [Alkalilacustris brevis]